MSKAYMRFDGYSWQYNPKKLILSSEKKLVSLCYPFSHSEALSLCSHPYELSGEGELFGADCLLSFERLKELYSGKKKGVLCVPGLGSFYAYFSALKMTAEPKDDLISYYFKFTEAPCELIDVTKERYHIAEIDETLWDIAYLYGETIESLVEKNPQIRLIDELDIGQKVRIC